MTTQCEGDFEVVLESLDYGFVLKLRSGAVFRLAMAANTVAPVQHEDHGFTFESKAESYDEERLRFDDPDALRRAGSTSIGKGGHDQSRATLEKDCKGVAVESKI